MSCSAVATGPRKGGNLVVEACRLAREAGREVILHVVGVGAEVVPTDSFIVVHGVLDKRNAAHRATLQHLLSICHVFFTPSRAEAYGMSFCEASAWAMPSLTTAVGGIPSIIEDGSTGWTLPPEADATAYAEKLLEMTSPADQYRAMAWRARRDYEARLNWPAFIAAAVADPARGLAIVWCFGDTARIEQLDVRGTPPVHPVRSRASGVPQSGQAGATLHSVPRAVSIGVGQSGRRVQTAGEPLLLLPCREDEVLTIKC